MELTIQSQTRLQINFIQAVDIHGAGVNEGDIHIMPEDGSLYMILQSSITILKVPISSSDPFFLDIPFEMISGVKVQTSMLVASQEPGASENVSQLLLNMETGAQNHNLCVDEGEAKSMLLTFNDMAQAKQVAMYIDDERMQRQTSVPKISTSQPLNISQDIQSSTSPQQPTEAESQQVMGIDESQPVAREASPAISQNRQAPQRKSTRSTAGASKRTNVEVATPGPRTGLENGESVAEGNTETEAEQHHENEQVNDQEDTMKPATGNLSILLSAALSPESEEPLFQPARRARNRVTGIVKGLTHSANIAAKPKATRAAKDKQPKQAEPATKNTTAVRAETVKKRPNTAPEQSDKVDEDQIWDIPSDPADLKQTTVKIREGKTVTTTVKNATRKTPARPAKTQANKRRTWVVESESGTESDGNQDDGNFKASSARMVPSSSPRRSARLQASAAKENPAPMKISRNHISDGGSPEVERLSSPTNPSPQIRSSAASQRAGTVGQAARFAGSQKQTTPVIANRRSPQQAEKPDTGGKKQQISVSTRGGDENSSLISLPQDESTETIEDFEEAVVDFETEPGIQEKKVVVKKEPGRKSKTPEQTDKQTVPQKRPIIIISDPESEDDPEEDSHIEGGIQEAAKQVQKVVPTTLAKTVQDKSRATNGADVEGAYDEVSMVEDSYPSVIKDSHPATKNSNALAKRDSTPEGASDPTLVDNKSARKMTIISFDRSGPRNQGVRLGLRWGNGTPTVRSDPAQAREGLNAAGESHATREMGIQTQPTFRLPGYVQTRETRGPRNEKRFARNDVQEKEPVKRRRTSQSMPNDDGFVDIDSYPDPAGKASRRASQRSVHITDGGSPIRTDFDDEGTTVNTDFGDIEDDFLNQGSDDGNGDPVMHNVPAPPVEIVSPNLTAHAKASRTTQRQERVSKSISPAQGNSRIAMTLAQGPTKPLHDQTIEDVDDESFAVQDLLSILRSSQKGSQTRGDEREMYQVSRAASPLLLPVGSRDNRAKLGAPHRRISSGRTQRSSAPLSSNHKPVPQPPDLDSQVISAYAPEKEVEEAVARNREEEKHNDPFSSSHKNEEARQSFFMLRLAKLMEERASNPANGDLVEDADKTLVEDVSMEDLENSSTSDEGLAMVVEEPEEEGEENGEEMEWEAALQPRHRDMFEVLGRITRRLVSHLIDSETAVEDVIADYGRDGSRIVEEFEKCFCGQQSNAGGLQASTAKLKKMYGDTERQIVQNYNVLLKDIGSSLHDWNAGMHDKKTAIELIDRMTSA